MTAAGLHARGGTAERQRRGLPPAAVGARHRRRRGRADASPRSAGATSSRRPRRSRPRSPTSARIEDLPLALGAFFALLASATVAHALVTTVRRRRHDLAVLRAIGFTRRQTRGAIAWQSTLLAVAGLVVGVPVGIAVGRIAWRWLADDFPIVYVPPLRRCSRCWSWPRIAIAIANALAAGPAHAASPHPPRGGPARRVTVATRTPVCASEQGYRRRAPSPMTVTSAAVLDLDSRQRPSCADIWRSQCMAAN